MWRAGAAFDGIADGGGGDDDDDGSAPSPSPSPSFDDASSSDVASSSDATAPGFGIVAGAYDPGSVSGRQHDVHDVIFALHTFPPVSYTHLTLPTILRV